VILPDVLRWLWQGWPAAVPAGQSQNDMLAAIVRPGEGWQQVGGARKSADGLACNQWGEVYFNDSAAHAIYRISTSGETTVFAQNTPAISGEAFGPDGTLFATAAAEGEIMAYDIHGAARKIADGVHGNRILVTKNRSLYVSEPGAHADDPSALWLIGEGGDKKTVDTGLLAPSGLAVSPDLTLLYAAEHGTQWVYSYVLGPDGSLLYKEPFFWLHQTDVPNGSGAEDMAMDRQGTLYVATRMGIQVCDRNGRVRAILPLPFPCGPLRSLCWGGPDFETLYVTDGTSVFKRNFKIAGHPSWAAPVLLPKANAG
jgi:sugar lactone lactonase YvrE